MFVAARYASMKEKKEEDIWTKPKFNNNAMKQSTWGSDQKKIKKTKNKKTKTKKQKQKTKNKQKTKK